MSKLTKEEKELVKYFAPRLIEDNILVRMARYGEVLEAYKDLKEWAAEGYSWGCTCKEEHDNYNNAIKILDEYFENLIKGN